MSSTGIQDVEWLDAKVAELSAENVKLREKLEVFRVAKLDLDEIEGAIDRQTYDEHQKAEFDMPEDAELHIILTAKEERRFGRAMTMMTQALGNYTPTGKP